MNDAVAISFLVPTYNGAPYLTTAIESIESQLIDGDEVLIQDGASTDDSLAQLAAAYPDASWLSVVSEPDDGQSDALGRALARAKNSYVIWLNADDVVYPGALAIVRAELAKGPDIVAGRSTIFNNAGRIVRTYSPGPITRKAMLGHSSDLFSGSLTMRTSLIRDVGGFNPRYQYCMDIDLFSRLAEREPTVRYIPDVIAGLRWHEASKGGTTIWPIVREAVEIKLAHSRTTPERALAVSTSASYLVAGFAQPVRHSAVYSAVRARMSKRSLTPDSGVH